MLKWYNNLYVGNNAEKSLQKAIDKLNHQRLVTGIYLITLASGEKNQLDIFSAVQLKQPALYDRCPMIVGIANGYEEALLLVVKILEETLKEKKNADMRAFLEEKMESDR